MRFTHVLHNILIVILLMSVLVSACQPTVRKYRTIDEIISEANGNLDQMRELLENSEVIHQFIYMCSILGDKKVVCDEFRQVLTDTGYPSVLDWNFFSLGLNEMGDILGVSQDKNAIINCSDKVYSFSPDLSAYTNLTREEAETNSSGFIDEIPAAEITNLCKDALSRSTKLFAPSDISSSDPNYQRAVDRSVSKMDQVAASCQDSNNLIAAENSVETVTPGESPTVTPSTTPGTLPSANSTPTTTETSPDSLTADDIAALMSAVQSMLSYFAASDAHFEGRLGSRQLFMAGLLASASHIGAFGSTMQGDPDLGSDVLTATGDLATGAGFAYDAWLAWGGAASLNVLPLAGAGFAGYTATRNVDHATDGGLSRLSVDVVGFVSDVMWEIEYGAENDDIVDIDGLAPQPDPDGDGKPTCAEMAQAWKLFKQYCSQPGNNWQSYDCMKFVLRSNGCVDPGLVNPSPQGELTCSIPPSEQEKNLLACELRKKLRCQFAKCTEDEIYACTSVTSIRQNILQQVYMVSLCNEVMPSPDGTTICGNGPIINAPEMNPEGPQTPDPRNTP